MYIHG
jgi:hypothetical protein